MLIRSKDVQPAEQDLIGAVRTAVQHANNAIADRNIVGGHSFLSNRGVVIPVYWAGQPPDQSGRWIQAVADQLESLLPIPLSISAASTRSPGVDDLLYRGGTHPAAFVGYTLDSWTELSNPLRGWQVDTSTTAVVAEAIQNWARDLADPDPWAFLPFGHEPVPVADVAPFLESSAHISQHTASVLYVAHDQSWFSVATLSEVGQCVTQTVVHEHSWRDLLETQTELLLSDPTRADVGMIKSAGPLALNWTATDIEYDSLHRTVRLPLDYLQNRHLWDEYVIDAAGINLLTSTHLGHARDLSDWNIEEVTPERFLVSAKNLEPWYSGLAADKGTVERARHDFGDMILSWDAILASPGPYTVTDPTVVGR